MRKLATLPSKALAEQFRFYLHHQAIDVHHHDDDAGEDSCAIWIITDEDLPLAQKFLDDFLRNPSDHRFKSQAAEGRRKFRQEERIQQAAVKAAERRERWNENFLTAFPITSIVIAISALVFLLSYFRHSLELTKFLLFSTTYGDFVLHNRSFHDILAGQVWRLVTPIFLHQGIFHIVFNVIWFYQLARIIEGSLTSRKLLILILGIAIPSNMAFYLIAGPGFGGLSGVIYGLFAYLWFRGTYSPNFSLRPDPQMAQFFVVWYVLCLGLTLFHGVFSIKVANSIHGVGALMGVVFGVWESFTLRHLIKSFQFNRQFRHHALIGFVLLVVGGIVDYLAY